tara:strand:+ start:46 stop:378 length:333 start_codon:yes stop_codon:yes gene_type:complete
MKSHQVKKWLTSEGIVVKSVKSMNGKRNGKTVTHYIQAHCSSEIYIMMREMMLKEIYGKDFENKSGRWCAGNVQPTLVSMTPQQWQSFIDSYTSYYDDVHAKIQAYEAIE